MSVKFSRSLRSAKLTESESMESDAKTNSPVKTKKKKGRKIRHTEDYTHFRLPEVENKVTTKEVKKKTKKNNNFNFLPKIDNVLEDLQPNLSLGTSENSGDVEVAVKKKRSRRKKRISDKENVKPEAKPDESSEDQADIIFKPRTRSRRQKTDTTTSSDSNIECIKNLLNKSGDELAKENDRPPLKRQQNVVVSEDDDVSEAPEEEGTSRKSGAAPLPGPSTIAVKTPLKAVRKSIGTPLKTGASMKTPLKVNGFVKTPLQSKDVITPKQQNVVVSEDDDVSEAPEEEGTSRKSGAASLPGPSTIAVKTPLKPVRKSIGTPLKTRASMKTHLKVIGSVKTPLKSKDVITPKPKDVMTPFKTKDVMTPLQLKDVRTPFKSARETVDTPANASRVSVNPPSKTRSSVTTPFKTRSSMPKRVSSTPILRPTSINKNKRSLESNTEEKEEYFDVDDSDSATDSDEQEREMSRIDLTSSTETEDDVTGKVVPKTSTATRSSVLRSKANGSILKRRSHSFDISELKALNESRAKKSVRFGETRPTLSRSDTFTLEEPSGKKRSCRNTPLKPRQVDISEINSPVHKKLFSTFDDDSSLNVKPLKSPSPRKSIEQSKRRSASFTVEDSQIFTSVRRSASFTIENGKRKSPILVLEDVSNPCINLSASSNSPEKVLRQSAAKLNISKSLISPFVKRLQKNRSSPSSSNTPINKKFNTSMKRSDKKNTSGKKFISTNMPNFALIHQKTYDKLENIQELKERKAKRAQMLLSGQKPKVGLNLIKPSPKPETTSKKQLFQSQPDQNSSKTKSPKKSPKKFISHLPRLVAKTAPKPEIQKPKIIDKPRPKVEKPMKLGQAQHKSVALTKFGFKKAATKEEQKKAVASKSSLNISGIENRRNYVNGVRTNKRFELLMAMRTKKGN